MPPRPRPPGSRVLMYVISAGGTEAVTSLHIDLTGER